MIRYNLILSPKKFMSEESSEHLFDRSEQSSHSYYDFVGQLEETSQKVRDEILKSPTPIINRGSLTVPPLSHRSLSENSDGSHEEKEILILQGKPEIQKNQEVDIKQIEQANDKDQEILQSLLNIHNNSREILRQHRLRIKQNYCSRTTLLEHRLKIVKTESQRSKIEDLIKKLKSQINTQQESDKQIVITKFFLQQRTFQQIVKLTKFKQELIQLFVNQQRNRHPQKTDLEIIRILKQERLPNFPPKKKKPKQIIKSQESQIDILNSISNSSQERSQSQHFLQKIEEPVSKREEKIDQKPIQ